MSSASIAFIIIRSPSMRISWISTILAAVDFASTSRTGSVLLICMKAPVAFCCATVARTQGSLTLTWAWTARLARVRADSAAARSRGRRVIIGRLLR